MSRPVPEHCETCGLPAKPWSGRRNDFIGLSSMWAKRAHAAEKAVAEALGALTDPELTDRAARNRAVAILEADA